MLCKICNRECPTIKSLNTHIIRSHTEVPTEVYYNTYYDKPIEHTNGLCLTCGKPTKFKGLSNGYQSYCNGSCAVKSDLTQAKIKKTNLERTGYEHNSLNPESQNRMQDTNKKNNGGVLYFQKKENIEKMRTDKINKFGSVNNIEKIKSTNLKRYGVENQFQSKTIIAQSKLIKIAKYGSVNNIEKIKSTNLEKYGVKSQLQRKITHVKKHESLQNKLYVKYNSILTAENIQLLNAKLTEKLTCHCNVCNSDFEIQCQLVRRRVLDSRKICIVCNPLISEYNVSDLENDLFNFMSQYIKCEQSNRTVLNGKELDIFIPSKNIAIEFNGLYWHSEENKEFDYHLKKTEECEAKGIQLIHVYEDDWLYKQDIVKSRLKSILGIYDRKIFARKTIIKELDSKTSKQFLDENHIQNSTNAKYQYGLYFSDELVAVMTFGSSRFEKNKMELHRFANKLNTNVIGGASRLFKYFLSKDISSSVISYADRSWSQGKLYETLGFKLLSKSRPNYSYIINDIREQRFKHRKSELVKQGFDKDKTEVSIMNARGYYRIYDSGSLKFAYIK